MFGIKVIILIGSAHKVLSIRDVVQSTGTRQLGNTNPSKGKSILSRENTAKLNGADVQTQLQQLETVKHHTVKPVLRLAFFSYWSKDK